MDGYIPPFYKPCSEEPDVCCVYIDRIKELEAKLDQINELSA